MIAVEGACPAERACDRKRKALREAREIGAGRLRPPCPAENGDRALSLREQRAEFAHLGRAGPDRRSLGPRRVGDLGRFGQHILGQRDHHRPRPTLHCDVESPLHDLRDLPRACNLGRPFGGGAEQGAIVHLLKGAPSHHRALDLPDEQNERRRVVLGDMNPVRGVGRAGAPRHEADPGAAGQPAVGQGHHGGARLLTADGEGERRVAHRVERGEIGLAGHAIDALDPLGHQLVDENLSAGAGTRMSHEGNP